MQDLVNFFPRFVARIPATVHTKLLVPFLAIVSLFVLLGAVGLGVLDRANTRSEVLIDLGRRVAAYRQIQYNARDLLYTISAAFLATDAARFEAGVRRMDQFSYDFDRARFVSSGPESVLSEIEADYTQLVKLGRQIFELIRDGKVDEARVLRSTLVDGPARRIERNALSLVNLAESQMLTEVEAGKKWFRASQAVVVFLSMGSVVAALFLGYTMSWSIIGPVKRINERLKLIAGGDFSSRLDIVNRDELGELAVSVNRMSSDLDTLYAQLEDANSRKSQFLASMSHDLRTPMNAIIGYTRILLRQLEGRIDDRQHRNLDNIRISADNLLILINDILDLSRIEAGRIDIEPEDVDLGQLVNDCVTSVRPLVKVRVVLEVSLEDVKVHTDSDRLRRIMMNLLSNAVKFTQEGRITVSLRKEDEKAALSIADTGVGIAAEDLPYIFDEFRQVDGFAKKQGTGLGLSIVKKSVELLGGKISTVSELGKGTTFALWIGDYDPGS